AFRLEEADPRPCSVTSRAWRMLTRAPERRATAAAATPVQLSFNATSALTARPTPEFPTQPRSTHENHTPGDSVRVRQAFQPVSSASRAEASKAEPKLHRDAS